MRRIALLLSLVFLGTGCSGAYSYVVADEAAVPVSMSEGVRGPDGRLLDAAEIEKVGDFKYDYLAWTMLWNEIPLTGDEDISDELNEQVKAAGGEAVINLTVTSDSSKWNGFTLLGILPGCNSTTITGDIIRRRSQTASNTSQAGR